jgi:hypothetical protein
LGFGPCETKNGFCHEMFLKDKGLLPSNFPLTLDIGRPCNLVGFGFKRAFLLGTLDWPPQGDSILDRDNLHVLRGHRQGPHHALAVALGHRRSVSLAPADSAALKLATPS